MASLQFNKLPVYLKALEVFKISRSISYCMDSENILPRALNTSRNDKFAQEIVMDSLGLAPQLALVQNSNSASKRLSHIKKIRSASTRILHKCRKMELSNIKEKEFLNILSTEIQQFERLFSEWIEKLQLKKGLQ